MPGSYFVYGLSGATKGFSRVLRDGTIRPTRKAPLRRR